MRSFSFWQRWLLIVGIVVTLFGVFMAIFNNTPIFKFFNDQIDPVFWASRLQPIPALSFRTSVYGVWGATVAGWGLTLPFSPGIHSSDGSVGRATHCSAACLSGTCSTQGYQSTSGCTSMPPSTHCPLCLLDCPLSSPGKRLLLNNSPDKINTNGDHHQFLTVITHRFVTLTVT